MIPTPIPPHVIATVFQYILPPSLPIPPHLVSPQLSERHRFLSISPTDIVSYLCWPSHESSEIVRALEGTPYDTWASEYHVRYTAPDEETLLAHVRPTEQSPIQVVFSWDGSWKYHDTRLWPLPSSSYASLEEALANMSGTRSSSPDSGDYWAGYGSGDDSPRKSSSVNIGDEEKAEAAYWASYSVVQGSGDSTVPSPRPEKQTQPEYSPNARGPETAFDPFIANLHLRLQRENGRMSGKSSPQSHSPQPVNNVGVDEASSPGDEERSCNGDFPHISKLTWLGESNAWVCGTNGCGKGLPELVPETKSDNQLEQGLKESVRGLYRMWTTGFGTNDKEAFITIVKDALE